METDLIKTLRESVCQELEIFQEGKERYVVDTPFGFDDGDSFVIVLKKDEGGWHFTDEGHTLMHLSYYDLDIPSTKGKRRSFFNNILETHNIEDRNGELIIRIENEQYGDSLFSFIQALTKITDLSFIRKQHISSLFKEDFKEYMKQTFGDKCTFSYSEPKHDPDGNYVVDCYVDLDRPLLIFALTGDYRCKDAIITCLAFKEWGYTFNSIGVFEESKNISPKVLAQSMDWVDKQFSTLTSAKELMPEYTKKMALC
ncbi:DUF1828 domain-containing protein [Methanohalophilus halophilus]|uniref:DUF1828 domain-containing protein n=1 Tax=Methanohalophilus halophilus TaxID=2177 RepID=A0A1L3Q115_9EURY|nr:DUF1828 domain-containing protein [Methanohalophilus halophilus]APH38545.1 hypothetical protein BHR79_02925 [Methanohalophilus halophilus]RNI08461.1 DUF1828 domain-containing protein [Methanohalophilus halophilus]SDW13575.1 protein of unknown function DUF1828 [Methanohalophilus halophilus]